MTRAEVVVLLAAILATIGAYVQHRNVALEGRLAAAVARAAEAEQVLYSERWALVACYQEAHRAR